MNKKKGLILAVIGIVGLLIMIAAITYAFFNYVKEGTTDNTITTSTITFLYTEIDKVGNGISINDAYPISDTQGKMLSGATEVFDFKITSTTPNTSSIPYEITARKKSDSTLDESAVKLYLTKVTGTSEEEVLLSKYSDLTQTQKVSTDKYTEKTIYTGKVPANSESYEQAFKLRMWISSDTDFSPVEDSEGNVIYPYNNKEFTVTVNVYANAKVVTEEDVILENDTNISSLSVNGTELIPVTDEDYDYETSFPEGTTSTTIDIETVNPYSTVTVEKVDSLAYSNDIRRLGVTKKLELAEGNNYFKITVISENKEIEAEYNIKILVGKAMTLDSNVALNVGDMVTGIDGSKWHVLEASPKGNATVVLLSDYNLNSDGSYNDSCGLDINTTVVCSPMAFDTNNTNTYDESDTNNVGYFIKYTYTPIVTSLLPNTVNVTLPTINQIMEADGQEFEDTYQGINSRWLLFTDYWTKTNSKSTRVWRVSYVEYGNDTYNPYARTADSSGVRPVITTLKSNLLAE